MDREQVKKTICPIPWNHSAVMQNGEYGICCQCIYNAAGRLITDDVPESVDKTDVDTVRNHPTYVELRKSMLNGEQHPLCKLCWDDEAAGRHSKRTVVLDQYSNIVDKIIDSNDKSGVINTEEFPLNYLDLRLGNLCNYACRSCGPSDSSLWVDFMDTNQFHIVGRPGTYTTSKVGASIKIDSEDYAYYKRHGFVNFLTKSLPTVDRIYFTGGEPLLNKKHYEILDYCIEQGFAKNISLEYNTNGSTLNKNLIDQWKHFKQVNICFSIDAMGPLANYIRYPSDWDTVLSNMRLVDESDLPHIVCTTNCTVSVLNIMHLPEFFTWFHKQNFKKFIPYLGWHRLVFPAFLNVQILPADAKEYITNYYNEFIENSDIPDIKNHIYSIVDYMNQEDQSSKLFQACIITYRQDMKRGQKLRDYLPWLADIYDSRFRENE